MTDELPPIAFELDFEAAAAAKSSLGIEDTVEVGVIEDYDEAPGFAWVEFVQVPVMVVLTNRLTPAMASWCVWHELAHVRQVLIDYRGDFEGFLEDYDEHNRCWSEHRQYNLAPFEAEAHLTAWENRMTPLAGPGVKGVVDHSNAPDPWHFMLLSEFDTRDIIEIGTTYREGMRR